MYSFIYLFIYYLSMYVFLHFCKGYEKSKTFQLAIPTANEKASYLY